MFWALYHLIQAACITQLHDNHREVSAGVLGTVQEKEEDGEEEEEAEEEEEENEEKGNRACKNQVSQRREKEQVFITTPS